MVTQNVYGIILLSTARWGGCYYVLQSQAAGGPTLATRGAEEAAAGAEINILATTISFLLLDSRERPRRSRYY